MTALLMLFAVLGGFNVIVDPYGRFGILNIEGFNSLKFTFKKHGRIGKSFSLIQCDFNAVILGSSRSETGLNPDHPAFSNHNAFNASLKAVSMYEINRMALHALENQDIKLAVIGLDFISFNGNRRISDDFDESPLAEHQAFGSLLRYALSVSTLSESAVTVEWNRKGLIKACEYKGYVDQGRPRSLPRNAFNTMYKRFLTNDAIYGDYVVNDEYMELFEQMLRTLAASDVEVYLYIQPTHATNAELVESLGLTSELEDWKRNIIKTTERVNSELPESNRIRLWDFSGYNSITTEAVPPESDGTYMRWYRDSSHFSNRAGGLVLDRIFGTRSDKDSLPADYGIAIDSTNIESWLTQQRAASQLYRKQRPADIEHLKTNIRQYKPQAGDNPVP
ncbi:MAG: hypothetical protein ACR2QG_06890 [Gammaproteobacteria bacterium]